MAVAECDALRARHHFSLSISPSSSSLFLKNENRRALTRLNQNVVSLLLLLGNKRRLVKGKRRRRIQQQQRQRRPAGYVLM